MIFKEQLVKKTMVQKENIKKRSPMNVSVESRLLGVSITIFVLLLTLKSELLEETIIISQLALSIPFLVVSMITNAKIVDSDSLKDYYLFNRITNSIGISLVFNAIGLLISNYLSKVIGLAFFAMILVLLAGLLYLDFNQRKFYNEILIITLIFLLGLLPAIVM
jgi:hypothetical protein